MSSMFGSGSEEIYIDSVWGHKDESTGGKYYMIGKKRTTKNPVQ